MSEVSVEREAAISQLMETISLERSAALVQTLEGIQTERSALLKAIAQIVIWGDFQAKAMFARVFVLTACLVVLYFLLRLVYRFMRERETFGIKQVLETILVLVVTAIPIMLIGVLVIEFTKPDLAEIEQMTDDFLRVQAVQPKE
jgi:magnesium-transporting ATPase (P-type)